MLVDEADDLLPDEAFFDLLFETVLIANVDLVSGCLVPVAGALNPADAAVDPLLETDLAADDDFATEVLAEDDFAVEDGAAEAETEAEVDFATEVLLLAAEPEVVAVLEVCVGPEYPLGEFPLTVLPTVEPDTGDFEADAEAEPEAEAEVLFDILLEPKTAETPEVASDASILPLVWEAEPLAPFEPLAPLAPDCELPLGFEGEPEAFLLLLMTT